MSRPKVYGTWTNAVNLAMRYGLASTRLESCPGLSSDNRHASEQLEGHPNSAETVLAHLLRPTGAGVACHSRVFLLGTTSQAKACLHDASVIERTPSRQVISRAHGSPNVIRHGSIWFSRVFSIRMVQQWCMNGATKPLQNCDLPADNKN